jgi:hypothetical protein
MKKTDFEQEMQRKTLEHTHAIEMAKLNHAQSLERRSADLAGAASIARLIGEEVRGTLTAQMNALMPLYEHMGAEATAAHLRLQIEQSVAMLITLGEKGLESMVKAEEVRVTKNSAQEARDLVNLLTGTLLDAIEDLSYNRFYEDEEESEDSGDDDPIGPWKAQSGPKWYTAYPDGSFRQAETCETETEDNDPMD